MTLLNDDAAPMTTLSNEEHDDTNVRPLLLSDPPPSRDDDDTLLLSDSLSFSLCVSIAATTMTTSEIDRSAGILTGLFHWLAVRVQVGKWRKPVKRAGFWYWANWGETELFSPLYLMYVKFGG